ncbi:MAG TPA: ribonuclease III [Spirochaetota bacterium]|nr:ribonuclease III [Spirochaetota bacterium]HPJ33773.1 ribonuclease III [Spirochaetota bacterium]
MNHKKKEKSESDSKKIRYKQLSILQNIIHVKFKEKSLLNRALIHRSYVNESSTDKIKDNERLEYLGDSVLGLIVNEYLFRRFEDYPEGDLAKIKSAVVSEATLAKVARDINLGNYLLMGKGEELSGGRDRASILANSFEALIGAVYLDSGLRECRKFILALLKKDIERIDRMTYLRDPKTTLQEYVQKKYKERPVYEVIEERGPDHKKEFIVRLLIKGNEVSRGTGSSKRKAEMMAAEHILKKIEKSGGEI